MAETFRPNTIALNGIYITTHKGEILSVTDLVQRIEFYESVYVNNVYGFVELADGTDLPQTAPLIGEESITININLPGNTSASNFVFEKFKIYKITDRHIIDDKLQRYRLWFISNEAVSNFETKISRSWRQETTDQIVRYAFGQLNSPKLDTLNIEQTIGVHNYVGTNISPFEIINYLASSRSINRKNLSDFVFFESLDTSSTNKEKKTRFNFVSLNSLCEKEAIVQFYFGPFNVRVDDKIRSYPCNIEDIEISKGFDILESKMSGMYNQTFIYYDMLRKKYVFQKNNYEEVFNESKNYKIDGLNSNKIFVNNSNTPSEFIKFVHVSGFPGKISSKREINNTTNRAVERKRERSTNRWIDTFGSREDKVSSLVEKTLYRRRVLMQEFENNKILLNNISGNYSYSIGNTVIFNKPHIQLNKTQAIRERGTYDKYISGKYLITGTNHVIKLTDKMNWEYKTHLEISKNSVKSKIS